MMKFKHLLSITAAVAAAVAGLVFQGCSKQEQVKLSDSVVKNLQTAYNGERNASAKYAMYADKAAEAGYASVAALFRAASRSEGLHAARQEKVLKAYGIQPVAEVKLPEFVDVPTALADAIKGETYEKDTMYPEFIKDAKAANAPADVVNAFEYAMDAEKEHARMYTAASVSLDEWKNAGKVFYVCSICGYTTDVKPSSCEVCAAPGDKFEEYK